MFLKNKILKSRDFVQTQPTVVRQLEGFEPVFLLIALADDFEGHQVRYVDHHRTEVAHRHANQCRVLPRCVVAHCRVVDRINVRMAVPGD